MTYWPVVPSRDSILHLTPAAGVVRFRTNMEWSLPLIGWAVVVGRVGLAKAGQETVMEYQTDLQAVVMAEHRYPVTVQDYLEERDPGIAHTVELRAAGDLQPRGEGAPVDNAAAGLQWLADVRAGRAALTLEQAQAIRETLAGVERAEEARREFLELDGQGGGPEP